MIENIVGSISSAFLFFIPLAQNRRIEEYILPDSF
jgi:hypothetical protein